MVCCEFEECVFGQECSIIHSHIDSHRTLVSIRMLQGLKTSLAVRRRGIEWVLADAWDVCDAHIDDIMFGTQKKEGISDEDLIVVGH